MIKDTCLPTKFVLGYQTPDLGSSGTHHFLQTYTDMARIINKNTTPSIGKTYYIVYYIA